MKILIPLLILLLHATASAAVQKCDDGIAIQASALIATINTWTHLHQFYEKYLSCDDGYVAEGVSEKVTVMLAEDWSSLNELEPFQRADPMFEKFILHHVDATVPTDRLTSIWKQADTQCPPTLIKFCQQLKASAITQ